MNWEAEGRRALKHIDKLEKDVAALEERMNNQYNATEDLIRRVSKLERAAKPAA